MNNDTELIKKALVVTGHVSDQDFEKALKKSEETGKDIKKVILSEGLISEDNLIKAISIETNIPVIDADTEEVDDDVFLRIPEIVARSNGVVATRKTEKEVKVAMLNPFDIDLIHILEKRFGTNVSPHFITKTDLEKLLLRYKKDVRSVFSDLIEQLKKAEGNSDQQNKLMIEMVDTLLSAAHFNGASDIHIEPRQDEAMVRFRIDGVMHEILSMDKKLNALFLTRIKIMAKMRTDEHLAAQDGKLSFEAEPLYVAKGGSNKERVDVRVSVVPVTNGENVVMRLLSSEGRRYALENIGLSQTDMEKMQRALSTPHGMVLVTGPTGSGKTTTLYSLVKILNRPEVHIATIEDPVEYDVSGISQIQVNKQTDLTFAKGLRAIVRQDPDIILVGEIRDNETAEIAINSAMTGHLVLSTLHANDVPTTMPRLLDMGLEPFLVSSTIRVVIAQRLVRKVCDHCKASHELTDDEFEAAMKEPAVAEIFIRKGYTKENTKRPTVFRGNTCSICNHSGYVGRTGIFEVAEMTEGLRELVLKRASSDEIRNFLKKEGMTSMLEDGMEKVFEGVTTIEEVLRVTRT